MAVAYRTKSGINQIQNFFRNNRTKSNLLGNSNFFLDIDRLFLCVANGLEAISILQEFGLCFSNTVIKSSSQNTSSQVCFFKNIYLEILWPENIQQQIDTEINFSARANWQYTKASPFGIGLRIKRPYLQSDNELIKQYFIRDLIIDEYLYYFRANQNNILEPFIFILPDYLEYNQMLAQNISSQNRYTSHPLGVKNVTDITIQFQDGRRRCSKIIDVLNNDNNIFDIVRASEPLLELTFDHGRQNKQLDARPTLPLIIKY
ncbi:MAG: hypothetical protein AAGA80_17010 [Cyanobacteria bacterium P01_F01_bin.143]